MFKQGGSAPRSNPLPVYVPFFTKKLSLSYRSGLWATADIHCMQYKHSSSQEAFSEKKIQIVKLEKNQYGLMVELREVRTRGQLTSLITSLVLFSLVLWLRPHLHGSGQIFERTNFLPVQTVYTKPYKICCRLQYCCS